MAKVGRPSTYTEATAIAVCEGIAAGKSLPEICEAPGMPTCATIYNWLAKNPEFVDRYARAREIQGDLMDRLILEAAMAEPERVTIRMGGDEGGTKEQIDTGDIQHRRLKIDALKWRAAHLRPKVYGVQRQEVQHSGTLSLEQILAAASAPPEKPEREHG